MLLGMNVRRVYRLFHRSSISRESLVPRFHLYLGRMVIR